MEEIKELYLELKRQIWENAYNVNDNHWTKMTLNLDLIMNEFHKQNGILDILKRAVVEDELFKLDDDGVGNRHKYILVDYDSYHASSITSEEYELIKEWLENDK